MILMYYLLITMLVLIDQAIKYNIRISMNVGDSIPVIGDIFHITYIQNTGGAFSLLQGHMGILILLPAIFTVAILIYIHKKRTEHWSLLLSLSLICGGGIGNVADRIHLGYVVDFFDFRIWPIFNIADICVCCGCALLVFYIFFFEPRHKKKMAYEHAE